MIRAQIALLCEKTSRKSCQRLPNYGFKFLLENAENQRIDGPSYKIFYVLDEYSN